MAMKSQQCLQFIVINWRIYELSNMVCHKNITQIKLLAWQC